MVLICLTSVSLFLYFIAYASATALPSASINSTTPQLTERQILHVGDAEDVWCDRVAFRDDATGCTGSVYYSGLTPPDIKKTTNIKDNKSGDSILNKGLTAPVPHACDFRLPPSFVLARLRKSRACEKAAADASGIATMNRMLDELERKANWRSLQSLRLATDKAAIIKAALPSGTTQPGLPPINPQFSQLERYQLLNYILIGSKPVLAIADKIDKEMYTKYKVRPGIHDDWKAVLNKLVVDYKKLGENIHRDIKCLGGTTPPPSPGSPMDTSDFARRRVNGIEARYHSIFDSSGQGVSVIPLSSLQRRARTAIRSGPKAAKCPSCPKKNQPAKKTVPRSKVQPKIKPAVKPRKPTKAPQPRPPSTAKKVTPRPATRPRRVPGTSEPSKRATPRVKPRVVPKPTRKPRGKPRTRRRK